MEGMTGPSSQIAVGTRSTTKTRSDSMVLEMCLFVAARAEITFTAVRDGYDTHPCERLQGSTGLR